MDDGSASHNGDAVPLYRWELGSCRARAVSYFSSRPCKLGLPSAGLCGFFDFTCSEGLNKGAESLNLCDVQDTQLVFCRGPLPTMRRFSQGASKPVSRGTSPDLHAGLLGCVEIVFELLGGGSSQGWDEIRSLVWGFGAMVLVEKRMRNRPPFHQSQLNWKEAETTRPWQIGDRSEFQGRGFYALREGPGRENAGETGGSAEPMTWSPVCVCVCARLRLCLCGCALRVLTVLSACLRSLCYLPILAETCHLRGSPRCFVGARGRSCMAEALGLRGVTLGMQIVG